MLPMGREIRVGKLPQPVHSCESESGLLFLLFKFLIDVTPGVTADVTVDVTPGVTADVTVDVTPGVTADVTVDVTPGVTANMLQITNSFVELKKWMDSA